ncbi:MAG: CoA-binding protein [Promethearchaeota archaeon]
MNTSVIEKFLYPKSVAVIGASKNPLKGGYRIFNNLISNNFKGKVFPVNPNSKGKLFGLEFKKSVLEVEDDIDLAIFYVSNRIIPELLEECIEKGIKRAIIEASGFEEVGDKGLELKNKILKITDNFSKIRIIGPNCMGLTRIDGDSNGESDERGGFFSSFGVFTQYKRGNIAIISQSGMLNGGYLTFIMERYPNLGFRYSCSIGNKMDLSEIEFLEFLINDSTVNVIAIYLESFKDPRKFINLCRKAKTIPNKTIILIKGGLTSLGQKASLSHTGALAENSELINAIIKQSGVIHAHNFHELFQFAGTFSLIYNSGKNLPKQGNVAMIAGSGGAGTISADLTMEYGLNFPILGNEVYKTLEEVFPEWMPPNKFAFIDIWPAMEKAMMNGIKAETVISKVYKAILEEPTVEGLFNMLFCSKHFSAVSDINSIIEIISTSPKPIFFWLIGENDEVQRISTLLGKHNIPDFPSLEDLVKNFRILVQEGITKAKAFK